MAVEYVVGNGALGGTKAEPAMKSGPADEKPPQAGLYSLFGPCFVKNGNPSIYKSTRGAWKVGTDAGIYYARCYLLKVA